MKIEQLYTGCLAEAAYYIESDGEAAVIDPLRDTQPYQELARASGATIRYVFETHFHADFVSGHLDLARDTHAAVIFGPTAQPGYDAYVAEDGEEFRLGKVTIRVLHTPGHTLESSTFLLIDENGKDHALFTGDTLFLGDVGRPDLAVKADLSREDLAGHLFDSLRTKIMPLADDIILYPGHGQGSACGKMMSADTVGTLGHQKETNYALNPEMGREEFIKAITEGLVTPPQYFPKNAVLNKRGYESIEEVLKRGTVALRVSEFKALMQEEQTLVLDTRTPDAFAEAHIPGSLFIGLDDNFAPWVGALINDLNQSILFLADPGREQEVVTRLARVGYDQALGYLEGGLTAWVNAGETTATVNLIQAEAYTHMHGQGSTLLDVRKVSEFNSEHIDGAVNLPLDVFPTRWQELNPAASYFVHCAGGYRSMIAASWLLARGFQRVVNILNGYRDLSQTSLSRTQYQAPTTHL
ncbi:MAG TPA: MBL fold metallo-hydrolase [Cytophagales bacterium]|nr:MBL fold metallo-hydrolase [Cytophagales bacterium]HAP59340.1 MBL fold metallo-hydrolase [Cytophagales bacterium]